jgi:hypothetical protein
MPAHARPILAAGLLTLGGFIPASAQSAADSAGIRAAAMDYLEGFYLGDSTRNLRSIRPEVYTLGGAVNTSAVENLPFFSPDGKELYFVRDYGRVHHVPLREVLGEKP